MILKCDCKHKYQDSRYGPGRRVHNVCIKDRVVRHRCTVCGAIKEVSAVSPLHKGEL